jgi:imidazole glycerol-phosphate synthase subunit HisH
MRDILLFDYGVGNIHSLEKALSRAGHPVVVTNSAAGLGSACALVLPGVGAFGPAAAALEDARDSIREAIVRSLPCLGICLGMQLLFESSDESDGRGLGVIPGRVRRLRASRIPHMGWNGIETVPDPVFDGLADPVVYYANSFVAEPDIDECVIGWSEYDGDRFPAAIRTGAIVGLQFHPEKSAAGGLRMIDNFLAGLQ